MQVTVTREEAFFLACQSDRNTTMSDVAGMDHDELRVAAKIGLGLNTVMFEVEVVITHWDMHNY
jgi:hypothetical protein